MEEKYEPKIVAFCCNWSSYEGINAAGLSRIQYPHNVRIIRSMCTARIDPVFIIESLIQGADGVLILACPHGECYYGEGNYIAEKRMGFLKKAIEDSNVNPKRFRLEWISATEGEKFARAVKDMVGELQEIGPLHKKVVIPSIVEE